MDHSRAPILDALAEYRAAGRVSFTPPGHRQGRGADHRVRDLLGDGVFASDVLVLNGLDDRRLSKGILARAEELMADAVGADHAFFSTCGSSLSVKVAMLAVAGPGEKLAVPRNCHKSVALGLILGGIEPVWVRPRYDPELHLAHPPEARAYEQALNAHADIVGALLITPTDYGTCADIRRVSDVCHSRGVPLAVDEAWGAHFPFHPDLPEWAMNCGADVCVTSIHKMGGAIEQSSVYHVKGDRVGRTALAKRQELLDTTSPTSLVYATIDGWRRHMVEHGHELLDRALDLAAAVRAAIAGIGGLRPMEKEFTRYSHELDPLKMVIDVSELGVTGFAAADWLRAKRGISVGLCDHRRITAEFSYADTEAVTDRLLDALRNLAGNRGDLPAPIPIRLPAPDDLMLESVVSPREAFFARAETVPADEAPGRIAAELITPYPPGVPVIVPGERINRAVVDYLRDGLRAGMHVPNASDPELDSFTVVTDV